MKKFTNEVTQTVEVTLDETKFTEEWMADWRKSFYPFHTIQDHAQHLAQLCARGIVDPWTTFIEGYGPPHEMGIEFAIIDSEIDTTLEEDVAAEVDE